LFRVFRGDEEHAGLAAADSAQLVCWPYHGTEFHIYRQP
jgi:hypothetical protein